MAERRRGGRWTTDFYGRDDNAEVRRDRQAFLDALAADAPEVLAALRDRGLPAYQEATRRVRGLAARLLTAIRRAPADLRKANRTRSARERALCVAWVIRRAIAGEWAAAACWLPLSADPRSIEPAAWAASVEARLAPRVADLRKALGEWAARFGLQAAWLLDCALVILKDWSLAAAPPAPLHVTPLRTEGAIAPMPRRARRLVFLLDGWNPAGETRAAARERLTAAFTRHLDRHLDRVETLIEDFPQVLRLPVYFNRYLSRDKDALAARARPPEGQPVWRPMQERRARGPKRSPVDPFRLLAMYQADPSVSRAALARRVGLTLRGVTMLLRDAAQRVGLQLRPRARPGRPRRRSSP